MQPRIDVKVDDRSKAFTRIAQENLKNALRAMADSVLIDAQNLAPYDPQPKHKHEHLKQTGTLTSNGNTFTVSFGSGSVEYARIRHYENKKNPQTLRYLERAGNAVAKRGIQAYL